MNTPKIELLRTTVKASYKYSLVMNLLLNPIESIIANSFVCSNRFALIDEDKEKKHRNMILGIRMLNIMFIIKSVSPFVSSSVN